MILCSNQTVNQGMPVLEEITTQWYCPASITFAVTPCSHTLSENCWRYSHRNLGQRQQGFRDQTIHFWSIKMPSYNLRSNYIWERTNKNWCNCLKFNRKLSEMIMNSGMSQSFWECKVTPLSATKATCIKLGRYIYGSVSQFLMRMYISGLWTYSLIALILSAVNTMLFCSFLPL